MIFCVKFFDASPLTTFSPGHFLLLLPYWQHGRAWRRCSHLRAHANPALQRGSPLILVCVFLVCIDRANHRLTNVCVFPPFLSFFQERQDLKEARQAQTVAWMSNFTGMFAGSAPAAGGAGGTQSSPASPAVAAGGGARRMSGGGAIA